MTKTFLSVLLVLMAVILMQAPVLADVNIWGFTQAVYDNKSEDTSIVRSRLRVVGEKFYLEADLARSKEENWLHQAQYSFKTDGATINVGRVFTGGGCVTPPPFLLKTANYPRSPFIAYGYGVQVVKKVDNTEIKVDLTGGTTGTTFRSGNWQRAEVSARLRVMSKKGEYSLTTQASSKYQRFALDFESKATPATFIKGAVYGESTRIGKDKFGGYLFAGWAVSPYLELHSQMDL